MATESQNQGASRPPLGKVTAVEVSHRLYDFCLSQDDFAALIEVERDRIVPPELWIANLLERSPRAKEFGLGRLSVDFGDQFGPSISIMIEVEHDTPEAHALIAQIISERVEAAHEALAAITT